MTCFTQIHRYAIHALLVGMALLLGTEGHAQVIANTARALWLESGQDREVTSNTVQFAVASNIARIETLRPETGAPLYRDLTPSRCGGADVSLAAGAPVSVSLGSSAASTVSVGENLYIRIHDPNRNRDGGVIESVVVNVLGSNGDHEVLTIFETGEDTGIFLGAIPTADVPPAPVSGDCRVSVKAGDAVTIEHADASLQAVLRTTVNISADPYGLVFDSETGAPVDGVSVTLVDAATGAPAKVFGADGTTPWPSTVISGRPVTDGNGVVHTVASGEYRFPLTALGSYRIVVTPPAPYTAPSTATMAELSNLRRPDGQGLEILPASFGQNLTLSAPALVRVDIPVDRPGEVVGLTMQSSRQTTVAGDQVIHTIKVTNQDHTRIKRGVVLTSRTAAALRIRPGSIWIDGVQVNNGVSLTSDGLGLTIQLDDIAAGGTRTIVYAVTVRSDAAPGTVTSSAEATDRSGASARANVALKIERDVIAGRMTLIGRVAAGSCEQESQRRGIAGVRVMLEDGSYAITDADGRYHFEGVVPGAHVVQVLDHTLPKGGKLIDCGRTTRSAGSANSRFIIGQGGSLAVADFVAELPAVGPASEGNAEAAIASDRSAAGAETDWLGQGDGPNGFQFPAIDHNPRAPAVRVVVRHRKGQAVQLLNDGKPVDGVAFDGTQASATGYAVSVWRGIALSRETTRLTARLVDADGKVAGEFTRDVHFAATPARFELVPERSRLIADGSSRPVLAVRVLDRFGRPVHAGLTGGFTINAPYESAAQLDALQTRQLSGLDRAAPTWLVRGDDGVALIELAPTMVSGALRAEFISTEGTISRRYKLETWVVPGEQQWTLIGLAEGSVGARSVAKNMERAGNFDSDLGENARVAFYAKGRVLGRYLLTMNYDSAKQADDQRLLGAIDPNAYYTVFADGSDRRFDAASRKKLYVRIESRAFNALYGDYVTGFDKTELGRYVRTMTGLKGEATLGGLQVQGFAARSGDMHRRDELQGAGISGPYRLGSRAIVPNSETVVIEVRDRFRSEIVLERRTLVRFIDYDVDLLAGTISFKEPILSRDTLLNPRFIVIDYDIERANGGEINAGLRAELGMGEGALRIGSTLITDTSGAAGTRTDLVAVDLRARLAANTEIRAEAAVSRNGSAKNAHAWQVEAEHHDGKVDVLGYIHSTEDGFGVGQMNGAEQGRRKVGVDARYRFSDALAVNLSSWSDSSLVDQSLRRAVELAGTYRTPAAEARLGLTTFADRLGDGTSANSTVVEGAVTRRFLSNRLEVSGAGQIALGKSESIDLPSRYQVGLRYALNPAIKLTGTYEIAEGDAIRARTARAGVEVSPWDGARLLTGLGRQDIAESGKRSFATFGLTQSVPIGGNVMVDATLDSVRTLGSFDPRQLVNPAHPVASGGQLGDSGSLAEDFSAMTLGATWRHDRWSATARGEYRDGSLADRGGVTVGLIRQLGEGSAVGAGLTWTRATAAGGKTSSVVDAAISAAYRPASSAFAALTKIEYRSDAITGATAGDAGPVGRGALLIDGDAKVRRLIGSVSANWSPGKADGTQQTEVGVFAAIRHNFDRYEAFDLKGTSVVAGLDLRFGLAPKLEFGGQVTVRRGITDGTTSYAIGPQVGITPVDNMLLSIGYNITGFRDRDFSASRSTSRGLFAAVRMKFDAGLLGSLTGMR